MTQQEYAKYLFEILGEEPRLPDDYHGWEDFFWGLFQSFMPNGEGVAAVFEPLERGQELLERILPVYQATAECSTEILDSGNTPAFFYRSAEGAKQVSINGQTLLFPPRPHQKRRMPTPGKPANVCWRSCANLPFSTGMRN